MDTSFLRVYKRNTKESILVMFDLDGPIMDGMTTKCHIFTGHLNEDSYGKVKYNGDHCYVHRLIWEWFTDKRPKGLILHRCNNPSCGRISHLYEGNHSDNLHDAYKNGRSTPAKTSEIEVLACMSLLDEVKSSTKVARIMGQGVPKKIKQYYNLATNIRHRNLWSNLRPKYESLKEKTV